MNIFVIVASPDRLINNNVLREIKCPSSIKNYAPEEAYNINTFCRPLNVRRSVTRVSAFHFVCNYIVKDKIPNCPKHQ